MTLQEYLKNFPTQNKYTFGRFLRLRREELGISLRSMSKKVEMTPSYLSDIENGARYAPIKDINKFKQEFRIQPDEEEMFEELAYLTKDDCEPVIIRYLLENPEARKALKIAVKKNLDGKKLLEVIENTDIGL